MHGPDKIGSVSVPPVRGHGLAGRIRDLPAAVCRLWTRQAENSEHGEL